jgi:hypothetical protein
MRVIRPKLQGNLMQFAQNRRHEVSKRGDVFLNDLAAAALHGAFLPLLDWGIRPPEPPVVGPLFVGEFSSLPSNPILKV